MQLHLKVRMAALLGLEGQQAAQPISARPEVQEERVAKAELATVEGL